MVDAWEHRSTQRLMTRPRAREDEVTPSGLSQARTTMATAMVVLWWGDAKVNPWCWEVIGVDLRHGSLLPVH